MAKFNPIKEGAVVVDAEFDPIKEGAIQTNTDLDIVNNVDKVFQASENVQVNPYEISNELRSLPIEYEDSSDIQQQKPEDNKIGFVEALKNTKPVELIPFMGPFVSSTRIANDMAAMSRMAANPEPPKANIFLEGNALIDQQIKWIEDKVRVERMIEDIARNQRGFTVGGRIATGVAELPGFMIEFIATGPVFNSVKKSTQKAITEILGRHGVKIGKKLITKTGTITLGTAARTGLQATRVLKGVTERLSPGIEITEKGEVLLREAIDTPFTAVAKSFGDVFIENLSEISGPAISKAVSKVPFVGKFTAALKKQWERINPGGDFVSTMLQKGGYNGFLQELGEERVGDILRAVTKVQDFGDPGGSVFENIIQSIPGGEDLLVEAGVLAVPGLIGAVSGVGAKPKTKVVDGVEVPIEEPSAEAPIKPGQKTKERKFVTSVKEVVPELKIENQYIPRSTDELSIKAKNLINDNIAEAEKVALKGNSDTSVAVASELIKHYSEEASNAKTEVAKDALYEKAALIANDTARKLTEQGRAVQAASILGRLTPEGQVRFAAREIQKYNEKIEENKGGLFGLRKKIPELTKGQAEDILKEMKAIDKMPDGEAKAIRFQKFHKQMQDLVPSSLYQKAVTLWKAGLLTGLKTSGVNIFSNVSHLASETIKDVPATLVDKVVSLATGERTTAATVKGIGQGLAEGAKKGWRYLKTGYDERDIGVKLDYTRVNYGKGKLGKALNAYTETVFHTLGAEDQPFYYAAKVRSLYEQAKVQAINKGLKGKAAQAEIDNAIENPTEEMIKNASKDAEIAVYLNRTKLGDIARGIQKLPGGEIVVPFGRTPSAVAMQIVNYSPVGAMKTVVENIGKGRFNQREFSKGLGRAAVGTVPLAIGAALFKAGMMVLDFPQGERERELQKAEGRKPNSILIDGKWRSIQVLGPVGNLLIIGGHFQNEFSKSGSPSDAMTKAMAGSAKSFTEQTFLSGLSSFTDALKDPERSAPYFVGRTLSSVIPTIVSDVARVGDPKERRVLTISDRFLSRLPIARESLEPQIDFLGRDRSATGNPIELMIDPTRPSKDMSTPVVSEIRRLWDEGYEISPTKLGDKGGFESLTPKENTELWKRAGELTNTMISSVIKNPTYVNAEDKDKAKLIEKAVTAAQSVARMEVMLDKVKKLDTGKQVIDKMLELNEDGVIPKSFIE